MLYIAVRIFVDFLPLFYKLKFQVIFNDNILGGLTAIFMMIQFINIACNYLIIINILVNIGIIKNIQTLRIYR